MASKEARSYVSSRVLVLVSGVPVSGLAEDTFVTIAPMSDRVTSAVGADGEIARSINPDRRHTITLALQQTSASNDVLSTLAAADELSDGGSVFPVMVQDLSGRTLAAFSQAWISRMPDIAFGPTSATREWTLEAAAPTLLTVGGNS
jgi:hypothetical protein